MTDHDDLRRDYETLVHRCSEVVLERDRAEARVAEIQSALAETEQERSNAVEAMADAVDRADRVEQELNKARASRDAMERMVTAAGVDRQRAEARAERLADALREVRDLAGSNTVCVNYPPSPGSYGDLYHRADSALADAPEPKPCEKCERLRGLAFAVVNTKPGEWTVAVDGQAFNELDHALTPDRPAEESE